MGAEEQINKFAARITANSTALLMIAVILYFITLFFTSFTVVDPGTGTAFIPLFGEVLFLFINALLLAIVRLFAGLSFAAVCFDESKNIWFRVVAVAALMLIMFGGLNIM
jgi:hypothetical protein